MRMIRVAAQAGDTIIEVLIAIAVVSFVLVTAYATTNHSILATQNTQERSQALQLAQSQIEFLRSTPLSANNCFDSTGTPQVNNATFGNNPCVVTGDGNKAASGAQPAYTLDISKAGASSTYQISTKWASVVGSTQNNITLYYQP